MNNTKILEGTFEGTVVGGRWTRWDDEETGRSVPILSLECEVGERKLHPSLFFDADLVTSGNDTGKSRVQVSLETLKSYGVEVNPLDVAACNPHEFIPAMTGKTVGLFGKDDDGKQKVYLNRARKPDLKEEEVSALWAELSSDVPKSDAAKQETNKDEDADELGF